MMKKILMPITLSLISSSTLAALSQKNLELIITGVHTKKFAVANLYKAPLDTKEWYDITKEWNDVIASSTHEFVTKHAWHNRSLIRSYKQIKYANDKLIDAQVCWLLSKSESTRNISNHVLLADHFSAKFEAIEEEMKTLKTKLDEKKFLTHGQKKVAQVLHRLALTLETTAVKARNDLKK